MLMNYEDNIRNVTDNHKITALKEILKLVESLEKKRLPESESSSVFGRDGGDKWGFSSNLFSSGMF